MDLEFTEEEAALRDSVRDVIEGISPPSVVRAIFEEEGGADAVWRQMVELDWPGLAIAEEHGGVGMGFLELAIVAEQLGLTITEGVLIQDVVSGGPAATAGVRGATGNPASGDIVVSADGKRLEGIAELVAYADTLKIGDKITLGIVRAGQPLQLDVILGEFPVELIERRP